MEINNWIKNYKLISVLGKGSYAKVILARSNIDNKLYAIKIIKKKEIKDKISKEQVYIERNLLLNKFNNPFLVKFYNSFQTEKKLYFVLEYCSGGELYNLLKIKKRFNEIQCKFYTIQIILALESIHLNNYIYRDLKPENIIIDSKGYIRLTDFGLSKLDNNKNNSIVGTAEYFAPEIILKKNHNKSIDFWTLGCIVYEMLFGYPPFKGDTRKLLYDKIINKNPKYGSYTKGNVKDLIKKLLIKDSKERLGSLNGINEIKNHLWFKDIDWVKFNNKLIIPPFIPKTKNETDLNNFDIGFTDMSILTKTNSNESNIKFHYFEDFSINNKEENKFFSKKIERKISLNI